MISIKLLLNQSDGETALLPLQFKAIHIYNEETLRFIMDTEEKSVIAFLLLKVASLPVEAGVAWLPELEFSFLQLKPLF